MSTTVEREREEIFNIRRERLYPSPTNPRKFIGEVELKELAESIRTQGIVQPITARDNRPKDSTGIEQYEIVTGERRWRAAELAGLDDVPVIVRDYSDDQVLEIQIIENLQRQDISELDEARGYQALIDQSGFTAETVAARVGKSKKYVYDRIKLLALTPELQGLLSSGSISAGHAILLARLTAAQQTEFSNQKTNSYGGLYEWNGSIVSVRELGDHIRRRYHKRLYDAPFSPMNPLEMYAPTPCALCPKRTGHPSPEITKDDECQDPTCFDAKCTAFLKETLGKNPHLLQYTNEYVKPKNDRSITAQSNVSKLGEKKRCKAAEEAIQIDGNEVGKRFFICRDAKCPVHHPPTKVASTNSAEAKAQRKAVEDQEKLRTELYRRIVSSTTKLGRAELECVAFRLFQEWGYDLPAEIEHGLKTLGYEPGADEDDQMERVLAKMGDASIVQFVFAYALNQERRVESWDDPKDSALLLEFAKERKIDVAAIRASIAGEPKKAAAAKKAKVAKPKVQPKTAKKKPAAKTKAKPAGKKK